MRALSVVVAVAVLFLSAPARAVEQAGTGFEKLGAVSFQTSCAGPAQNQFQRAVALLHSFWFCAAMTASTDGERIETKAARSFLSAR
jgi:hypothetical protein